MFRRTLRLLGALPLMLVAAFLYIWIDYHHNFVAKNATLLFIPVPHPVVETRLDLVGVPMILAARN